MTDNSNAAPERIWALPDLTQEWAKDGGLGDRPYDHLADQYVEYIRADLARAQAQSGEGAIGKFFDWISDYRTPSYMALFWFVFLGGTIAAVSSAVVSPSAFPTIAIVTIAAGGALAFAYRRHIKATKGDE